MSLATLRRQSYWAGFITGIVAFLGFLGLAAAIAKVIR